MQSAPRTQPSWYKEHLWLALQALGFEPTSEAAAAGKTLAHVNIGVNMFDKPNKDAFYMVSHFLFAKLDNARCKEVFRYYWPPLDKKRDAEYRKACCEWLRKISEDSGLGFPQVVASLFLSPGGPKFVHLLYHFARYVMLQHIKNDVEGSNAYISESLQLKNLDPQKALARNNIARHQYLQTLQRENFMISQYQEKAQLLIKQIRDLRSECATLQSQNKVAEKADSSHKRDDNIQKTQNMWHKIMQTLKEMEKEIDVVDSVVRGNVDQYCLDGTNVSLNIPNLLVSTLESEMHKLQMENVYEAGKVNVVTVVQLLNEALKIVKQELQHDRQKLNLDNQYFTGKVKFETEVLARLEHMRCKIKREDIVAINKSIVEMENEWEKKWTRLLGKPPLSIYKDLNPVLEFQQSVTQFSFDPAPEEVLKNSVYSQYPVYIPEQDLPDKLVPSKSMDRAFGAALLRNLMDTPVLNSSGRNSLSSANRTPPLRRRMSLNEQDLRTPPASGMKDRSFNLSSSVQKRKAIEIWRKTENFTLSRTQTPNKQDPMSTARKDLAEQVADYIVSETPRSVGGRGVELDDLIGMLSSDPFLSRKEIPRTPENLISDIRTSWRKAIQTVESPCVVINPAEASCLESPAEQDPVHCSQVDLSMACFLSTSHVSDSNDSYDSKRSSAGRPRRHQPANLSHSTSEISFSGREGHTFIIEESKTESIPKVEDKNGTFALDNEQDKFIDSSFLLVQRPENPSAHTTLSWDSSNMVEFNSDSHGVIQFGILHETLPEGVDNLSLNSTKSLEANESIENDKQTDDLLEKADSDATVEHKMDFETIRSRYEALKRTFFTEHEDDYSLDLSSRRLPKQKSESSISQEAWNMLSPLQKEITLNMDYLMTPPAKDRKLSLPQLISFSPSEIGVGEEKLMDITDVFETQGPEHLNKTFDFKPSATDPQKYAEQLIYL